MICVAAFAAVFFACRADEVAGTRAYVIRQRGVPVGWVINRDLGIRRDGAGELALSEYRAEIARWADGVGVVAEELRFLAARRPGGPVYYLNGTWSGGSFRYRRGRGWTLNGEDEFGNAVLNSGTEPPAVVTFRGAALAVPTAGPSRRDTLTGLELTDGRVTVFRGRRASTGWAGRGVGGDVWVGFGEQGEVARFAGPDNITTGPAASIIERSGFLHRRPILRYLPTVFRAPSTADGEIVLPLSARLSAPTAVEDLTAAGQTFAGTAVGTFVSGVFTLTPAAQTPLGSARPARAADGGASFAPAPWYPWPAIEGDGELGRLAAAYRAEGRAPVFVSGVGLFAGNVLAPYEWLQVGAEAIAAPGRPIPRWRVALGRGPAPARVTEFALAGEPKARGAAAIAPTVPGLKDGDALVYTVYHRGAVAGLFTLRYDAAPPGPPVIVEDGEFLGAPSESITWGAFNVGGAVREATGGEDAFAELAALGSVVATARPDLAPPDEFAIPLAGSPLPLYGRWRGVTTIAAGAGLATVRVFELEPGAVQAYYTYDGVLARVRVGALEARLLELPRYRAGASAAQTGATATGEAAEAAPGPPPEGAPPTPVGTPVPVEGTVVR